MVRKAAAAEPAYVIADYMDPTRVASNIVNGLHKVGKGFYDVTLSALADIKIISRSSDGIDTVFRFIGESVVLLDLMQRSEKIARPVLNSLSNTRAFFYANRFVHSVHYFTSGDYHKDLIENKIAPFIAAAASAIGRTLFVFTWLEQHNLISLEKLGAIAAKIGSIPVLGGGIVMISSRFLYLVYLTESVALAKTNLTDIAEHKNVARNRVEFVSSCADVALSVLGIAGVANPYSVAVLGTIAATTSMMAFFLDPANTATSMP